MCLEASDPKSVKSIHRTPKLGKGHSDNRYSTSSKTVLTPVQFKISQLKIDNVYST